MSVDWSRYDLVLIGRVVGLLVIVGGFALSIWSAVDVGPFGDSASFQARVILDGALRWGASGGLLILAAEIADRLTWDWSAEEPLDNGESQT